jgi:hypothetical protein
MSEGFLTDPWTAMVFFRFCQRYHVESREDRISLIRELVRRKKARYIRDVESFTRGKKIVKIGFKPKRENS